MRANLNLYIETTRIETLELRLPGNFGNPPIVDEIPVRCPRCCERATMKDVAGSVNFTGIHNPLEPHRLELSLIFRKRHCPAPPNVSSSLIDQSLDVVGLDALKRAVQLLYEVRQVIAGASLAPSS